MQDAQSTQTDGGIDWNGAVGQTWVDQQVLLDRIFEPIEKKLTEEVAAHGPERLFDIGCGGGATTLALARRLGPGARCTGVDISAPLIAAARERAGREGLDTKFLCANAQDHHFSGNDADAIVSRFGIMFFADPVAAFLNLRRAMRPGGRLTLIAWRSPDQNPFMTEAVQAAAPLIDLPAFRPNKSGQFGFAEAPYVRGILDATGWTAPHLEPVDFYCAFPAAQLDTYVSEMGPLGAALKGAGKDEREKMLAAVRPAFDRYIVGETVNFTAACWVITARAPSASGGREEIAT
ncbi:class I SAM-dependent methyltransferase [Parasphingopyxis lamellibrachiae]|uniref:Methyltransferase family protein n=1 Tax=Parasphingopyxis lamellibrachiae TaxID=680125 RepID=A0A3D9FHH1_9SPHN|nr:class I SAM-dependent methyltransferase [Parasphingopyxis lamellibrachiae]RED17235.1 methyltransferase family protein [Parasphingopyxis lamellibrachiae]